MAEKRKDKDGRILPDNVVQRKDGTYMWKKTIDGKQYCEYAKTLGEIKEKGNKALYEIKNRTYQGKRERIKNDKEQSRKDLTLNEWHALWEQAYRVGKVKESTLKKGHMQYIHSYSDNVGKMKLKDIKQIDLVLLHQEMKKKGLSYHTIEHSNAYLVVMFEAAISNGYIETNPAKNAVQLEKDAPYEQRVLSEAEERRFMDYISSSKQYRRYVPFFEIGFNTGMRLGEIFALTWNDVDFEKKVIHVTKTLQYLPDKCTGGTWRFVLVPPKTKKSVRDIPMLPIVIQAFNAQREFCVKSNFAIGGYSDFVFTTKTGKPQYQGTMYVTIQTIIKEINQKEKESAKKEGRKPIYLEKFSAHSMRHTFATRCYENGVKEKVIQNILGHSTLNMTLNTYTHVTSDMILNDMKKMER